MDIYEATEQAYKNGYEKGRQDAMANEKSCDLCEGREYTEKPFKVITQRGIEVEVQFNYCPCCGRKLRTENGQA